MHLTHYLMLVLNLWSLLSAAEKAGCRLEVPEHVGMQKEANTDPGKPLVIFVDMKLLGVRDVPDSGGSYAMDIK